MFKYWNKFKAWLVAGIRRNSVQINKIFSFLGYFLLIIGLGYQIQRLYKKLKIEPEIYSKESSIQSSEIPFPAVTFCPPFTVKKEAWNPEFLRLNNLTTNDLRSVMLQVCTGDHEMHMEYIKGSQVEMYNFVNILSKSAPNFGEILNYCGINEYYMDFQDCEKLFVKSLTDYGICFTFNMLGHDTVFNKEVSSDFDTFRRAKIAKTWDPEQVIDEARHGADLMLSNWSLEEGYKYSDEYIQPARAQRMQTLAFETKSIVNESLCENRDKNYKLIIHLPNEVPQLSYQSIDILVGKDETLSITAEMVHNEDSLKSFTPKTRGCYFDGEKSLKFLKTYTKSNCEYECIANLTYQTCGCVKFSMPRTQKMKICDYDKDNCHADILRTFPRCYYKNARNRLENPNYPCGCLPSCTEMKYKVVKIDRKDSEHFETYLLSKVKVVFTESQIKKTSNYVTYEMENFVFDIGGLIGLFLGSSILSVLELFVDVCKAVKNQAGRALKWLKQSTEVEALGSVHLGEVESIEEFGVGIRTSEVIDEISAISASRRELRIGSMSERPKAEQDLEVEDLEN